MADPEKPTPTVAVTRGTIHFNPGGKRSIEEVRADIREIAKKQSPLTPIEDLMGSPEQK